MRQVARTHGSTHDNWAERILFSRWDFKHRIAYLLKTQSSDAVIAACVIGIPLIIITIIVFNS